MSEIKTTTVSYEDFKEQEDSEEGFRPPSKWYVLDAMGDRVFFHYQKRLKSQQMANEYYGSFKYTVRPYAITGKRDNITAK